MNTEVRLTFNRKFKFADGHSYGDAGPYERWVGTASFANPRAPLDVLKELEAWLDRHAVADVNEIIGCAQPLPA